MNGKHKSRKFLIAVAFCLAVICGLFVGKLTGGEFLAGMGTLIAAYFAADVAQDQLALRANGRVTSYNENETGVR